MRTYIHIYVRAYIRTYVRTYLPTYLHTCVRTYTNTYVHTHISTTRFTVRKRHFVFCEIHTIKSSYFSKYKKVRVHVVGTEFFKNYFDGCTNTGQRNFVQ